MPALEFCVAPDAFPRLLRLASLGKRGPRASPCDLVWHDSADGALADAGASLCEQGQTWRLEAAMPMPGQSWPPGTPPALLAEAASLEQLAHSHRLLQSFHLQPMVPLAGFHGRQRTIRFGDDTGQMTLLEGVLRGVTQERAVGRVVLHGPAASLLAMSDQAAAAVTLSVPRWSLAVEAIALARGHTPPPRRTGAAGVTPGTSLDDGIAHVLGHLVDVILATATSVSTRHGNPEGGHSAEPVHQMRVAARRLRSALSVFKRAVPDATFDTVNAAVKHLAAMAGDARDWDVFIDGTGSAVAAALPGDARIVAMLATCERRRIEAYADLSAYLASPAFRQLELSLVQLTALRGWADAADPERSARLQDDISHYASHTLDRLLDHMLAPGADIDELPPEPLHDIRKQGKRLRYACEFFAPLYGRRSTRRFIERLSVLQEALGHLNDSVSAGQLMAAAGNTASRQFAAGAVLGFVAARGSAIRGDIGPAWHKLRRQKPFWI